MIHRSPPPKNRISGAAPILGLAALAALLLTPLAAAAEVTVRFADGAPRDSFTITNESGCDLGEARLTIDLAPAPAGLIFDTTAAGAGFQVFQPVELGEDASGAVRGLSAVSDGDQTLAIDLIGVPAEGRVVVTADLDDTEPASALGRIRVSGAEIAGARAVLLLLGGGEAAAAFGDDGAARIPYSACVS